jgi:mannose-6-phosphate isomerase-like protein (cupin superfamily)
MSPPNLKRTADSFGRRDDKEWKATLFESPRLLLGVNCLEPGQAQKVHEHPAQDKFYAVQEGIGRFTVGADTFDAGPGDVVWAPAGMPHGVANAGKTRLSLLVGIAPGPHSDRRL